MNILSNLYNIYTIQMAINRLIAFNFDLQSMTIEYNID